MIELPLQAIPVGPIRQLLKTVALATLLVASVALAQPVAERPSVKVGDTWELQVKKRTEQSAASGGSRRVVEVSEDRVKIARKTGSGETLITYDRSFNEIEACHPECYRPTFQFPMRLGNKWEFERKTPDNGTRQTGTYEVVKYESIARQIVERRISGQYGPGQYDYDESELVRFTPGP